MTIILYATKTTRHNKSKYIQKHCNQFISVRIEALKWLKIIKHIQEGNPKIKLKPNK